MPARLRYLDSSAIVKLVVPEAESQALKAFLPHEPHPVSSALARVETLRAAARSSDASAIRDAEHVLAGITLLAITDAILTVAARLPPRLLRTLDAIHLASALSLGADLEGLITYDERLAEAARQGGVTVYTPR
jgi:uncharacterized protein